MLARQKANIFKHELHSLVVASAYIHTDKEVVSFSKTPSSTKKLNICNLKRMIQSFKKIRTSCSNAFLKCSMNKKNPIFLANSAEGNGAFETSRSMLILIAVMKPWVSDKKEPNKKIMFFS